MLQRRQTPTVKSLSPQIAEAYDNAKAHKRNDRSFSTCRTLLFVCVLAVFLVALQESILEVHVKVDVSKIAPFFKEIIPDSPSQRSLRRASVERGEETTVGRSVANLETLNTDTATTQDTRASEHTSSETEILKDEEPPVFVSREDSFGACLLIMDDNHWLIEWLAYHYHVLPLRELIVIIDPKSRTSPLQILNRWKDQINIQVWNDTMIEYPSPRDFWGPKDDNARGVHRVRQIHFYQQCMKELKDRGSSWVLVTDTDEFARPNEHVSTAHNTTYSLSEPGSIIKMLKKEQERRTKNFPVCLSAPRHQYGATESSQEFVQSGVPESLQEGQINGTSFLTTRWRYRSPKKMKLGKNLVRVAAMSPEDFPRRPPESVHAVNTELCPNKLGHSEKHRDSLVIVHHYTGSREQFSFRDDPRNKAGGRIKFDHSSDPATKMDDKVRSWVSGFVESVGVDEAKRLLEGVGQVGYE